MKTNVIVSNSKYLSSIPKTHEGTPTKRIDYKAQLKRSVMACLLWENTFYEGGVDIAERILSLVPKVKPKDVASIAVEARKEMNLRHAPLWIICAMLKASPQHKQLVGSIIPEIATRADQLPELLALYWKNGKTPLANQLKKGLAKAFRRFDTYQLAKYNRDESIKLRDVLSNLYTWN